MSYVGVPKVHRDPTIASSMVVQDYISKHVRREKPIPARHSLIDSHNLSRPKVLDCPFGNFPRAYKTNDYWDGNPTLRRDERTAYTSPSSPIKAHCCTHKVKQELARYHRKGQYQLGSSGRPMSSKPGGRHRPSNIAKVGVKGQYSRPKSASAVRSWTSSARPEARKNPCVGDQGQSFKVGGKQTGIRRKADRLKDAKNGNGNRWGSAEKKQMPRPKTAGYQGKGWENTRADENLPDREELEATRIYFLTKGKFRTTPTKLISSLEVAKVTNSRPASAPSYTRRKRVQPPPKAGAWHRRTITDTIFRKYYIRGDLPICVDHRGNGNAIKWKIRASDLDYHVYLPIFFEGLREVEDPYRFLATQGTLDMIEAAPDKILPVIPQVHMHSTGN
ncbi:unnamed protein product [Choristocarpus tenellus]